MAETLNIIEPSDAINVNVTEVGNEVTTNVVSKDISVDVILTGGIVQISGSGDKNFVFNQSSASSTWTINHTLDKFPAVEVVNSANTIVIGDITYNSTSQITITFTAAFSGKAYLN
jgi:hypothetical protein